MILAGLDIQNPTKFRTFFNLILNTLPVGAPSTSMISKSKNYWISPFINPLREGFAERPDCGRARKSPVLARV